MKTDTPIALSRLDALRSEQVAAVYHNAMPGTAASLVAAIVLAAMLTYLGAIKISAAATFVALIVAHSVARLALILGYRKARPSPHQWRPWAYGATASALAGGLSWGFGSWLLMDPTRPELQFFVFLICAAIAAGAITAFATYLPAFYCNELSIMLPTMVWAVWSGGIVHFTYAVLAAIWVAAIATVAWNYNRMLADSLRLQFENLDLATDLRRQKEVAEEANAGKSRFLAAASHDLRQPVHALGMFVGALRSRQMDEEAQRLVNHIDGSIGALDGLFTSLLDISRLDAGVPVNPSSFAIGQMLERICSDYVAEAAQKDIDLRLVPSSLSMNCDPVLLERILRNLISNAVRYTDKGRVLIGCRRRGDRASVEVWDTGRGIAPEARDLIFQEFFQIGNAERDRTRGLGLGLAIVQRLTGLLGTPLTLQSELGKGSCFRVSVARAPAPAIVSIPDTDVLSGTLHPRLILVIDDETAILDAMQSLLSGWGHRVIAAGSCAEMLDLVENSQSPPDLIITDYRLRANENGIDAIQRLRSEFNDDIPGILVTGDTAPDRLRDARASGCLLMHKPVSNSRLRAAITNLTIGRHGEPSPFHPKML